MRISEWLHEDPKTLDITRRKHNVKINREIFDILVSKLRTNHPEYFRDATSDYGVRMDDVNGDGQIDVVRGYVDSGGTHTQKVYLKNERVNMPWFHLRDPPNWFMFKIGVALLLTGIAFVLISLGV